jgi:predicted RNA binding protein YcfA (HicA-like mRNA interferase family)
MPVSGKEVVRRLVSSGWLVVSRRGSHVKLRRGALTVVVPLHANSTLGIGLLRAIERQTGEMLR